jgi:hypothetical protein
LMGLACPRLRRHPFKGTCSQKAGYHPPRVSGPWPGVPDSSGRTRAGSAAWARRSLTWSAARRTGTWWGRWPGRCPHPAAPPTPRPGPCQRTATCAGVNTEAFPCSLRTVIAVGCVDHRAPWAEQLVIIWSRLVSRSLDRGLTVIPVAARAASSRTGHLWLAFAGIERQHFPWHARGQRFRARLAPRLFARMFDEK